jgi:hypothetical protein
MRYKLEIIILKSIKTNTKYSNNNNFSENEYLTLNRF